MNKKTHSSLFSVSLKDNVAALSDRLVGRKDFRAREFVLQGRQGRLVYLSSTADKDKLRTDVLKPILGADTSRLEDVLPVMDIERVDNLRAVVDGLLCGMCAVLLDGTAEVLLADVAAAHVRSIQSPSNDQSIRAPQESYVEDMNTNLQLIHSRLRNSKLTERHFVLGSDNPFRVSMLYMADLADPEVTEQIAARLQAAHARFVKSPGVVSDLVEPHAWSLFPQVLLSERPDMSVSHLMEGKIVLVMDGSSYTITLPVTFFMFLQTPDDFTMRWWNGTFLRFLRLLSLVITLALPATYIAIVSNHFEVLPIDLVFSLKASLENVPLNPLFEALFMIISLELLKEAALQLPKSISPALSTVGGLVIGTEVVRANLVSTTMIVVIALTAVASFSFPNNEMRLALRLISIPVMFASAFLGFAGIAFSFSLLVMYLTTLESYGVPYFEPLAPLNPKRLWKAVVQLPARVGRRSP